MSKKFRSPFCFALAALVFSAVPLISGAYMWCYSQNVGVSFSQDWRYIFEVFGFYSPLVSGIACALVGILILKRKPNSIRCSSRAWFCYALCTNSAILVVLVPKIAGFFIFLFPLAAIFFSGRISAAVVSIVIGCLAFVSRVASPDMIALCVLIGIGYFFRSIALAFISYHGVHRGGLKSTFLFTLASLLASWSINIIFWNAAIRTLYPSTPLSYGLPFDAAASLIVFAILSSLLLSISSFACRSRTPSC